jgi:5-methylcytosine-specific restriction endonuclease McrBC regulatory subunit McrC
MRVSAQLARLPQRVDAHLLEADEFTADTAANRAIKGGIRRIQRLAQQTHGRCRELLARLDSVGETPPNRLADLLSGLILDRRHAHLVPLISILRLIVTGHGSAASAGADTLVPTLLFAMERLLEAYIAQRLRRIANRLEVSVQGPVRSFASDGSFSLRPDVVLLETGGRY